MRFTGLSLSNDISKLTSLGPTKSRKPSTRIWVYNSEIKALPRIYALGQI
jgi:hypothetical protein